MAGKIFICASAYDTGETERIAEDIKATTRNEVIYSNGESDDKEIQGCDLFICVVSVNLTESDNSFELLNKAITLGKKIAVIELEKTILPPAIEQVTTDYPRLDYSGSRDVFLQKVSELCGKKQSVNSEPTSTGTAFQLGNSMKEAIMRGNTQQESPSSTFLPASELQSPVQDGGFNNPSGGSNASAPKRKVSPVVIVCGVIMMLLIAAGLITFVLFSQSGDTLSAQVDTSEDVTIPILSGESTPSVIETVESTVSALETAPAESTTPVINTVASDSENTQTSVVQPVYLNELTFAKKYGKLWTRSETAPSGYYHTNSDAPGCWKDMDTLGHSVGPVRDNKQNFYTYGLHIDGGNDYACEYYVVYELGGQYTSFSGFVGFPGDVISVQWAHQYSKQFTIYADGMPIYTSPFMSAYSDPIPFEISVENVNNLMILYPATEGPNEAATIFDGMLS